MRRTVNSNRLTIPLLDNMNLDELDEIKWNLDNREKVVLMKTNSESLNTMLKNNNDYSDNSAEKEKPHQKRTMKDGKVFVPRESTVTELLQNPHGRTVYNIFTAIFVVLGFYTLLYDLAEKGRINVGQRLVGHSFSRLGTVAWIWAGMQLAVFGVYPLLSLWARYRRNLSKLPRMTRSWDVLWILLLIGFQLALLILPISTMLEQNIPSACSFIVIVESVRFVMKVHAYVRSVSPRACAAPVPPFNTYVYYLFAPTFIYRDNYPRTSHVRWRVVAARLLEVLVCIFFIAFLCEHFFIGTFSEYGKPNKAIKAKDFVTDFFIGMVAGMLNYIIVHFLLLHSWFNATSEMLMFADRQFYLDWWNCWTYSRYFRTSNIVVQDWLYVYIYQDVFKLTSSKIFSTVVLFVMSVIFHELIVSHAFGFFFPVIGTLFSGFGVFFLYTTRNMNPTLGNTFFWCSLILGNGVEWSLFCIEYFARVNCPPEREGIFAQLVPQSWLCVNITLPPNWEFQNAF